MLPSRGGKGGRPGYGIKESDLAAFNIRRALTTNQAVAPSKMLLTPTDRRAEALSLQVKLPDLRKSLPFSTDLFDGYTEFRAVTYTASLETIMKLLLKEQFERVEVIFGSAKLLEGKEEPLLVQKAIDNIASKKFIGFGGGKNKLTRSLLEHQVSGRLRLGVMKPGIVHSKIYLLNGKQGNQVLVGSANLSERALSGKQGEVLTAYDNHDWYWNEMVELYEALAASAKESDLELKTEVKPASFLTADDLPAFSKVKEGEPVVYFVPAAAPEPVSADDDHTFLAEMDALRQALATPLASNLPRPNKDGEIVITPAVRRQVNRDVAALSLNPEVKRPAKVEFVGERFIYNGKPVEPPDDPQAVANDAWVITQYFNLMQEFGPDAAIMQRSYFGFMGWMFFTPFMSWARRERQKESPKNADYKLLALIYGPANSGKSGVVGFLQAAMFGDRTSFSDKGKPKFTPTDCRKLREWRGVLPIFFDDVAGYRFANTKNSETLGETIAKEYDQAQNEGNEFYPCLVAAMNIDAREFSTQVRKRCLMVYANESVPEDDAELKARLDAAVLPLHNRIGTAFYAEYLNRMGNRLRRLEPGQWMDFDYLLESTQLIRDMLDENRGRMRVCRLGAGWWVGNDITRTLGI